MEATATVYDFRKATVAITPEAEVSVIEADEALESAISELSKIKNEISKLEEIEKALRDKITSTISDAETVVDCFGQKLLTYKKVISNRLDTTRFKVEMNDLYKNYCKPVESRVLRLGA